MTTPSQPLLGVFAAALTPLTDRLAPDFAAMARHCQWLLDNGCDGLAVLGTTGEANSFSVEERCAILEHLVANGVPAARLLPGTGCCAIPDTVQLSATALRLGLQGVLMLPPFYYKTVSDDGLFAAYAEVIERIGDARLRIYLYHFPQMSAVPLSAALIERLIGRYPGIVVGIKDSSGDLANMLAIARAFPGFAVMSGSDELLLPLLKAGGAGCITAVSNVAAPIAAEVLACWRLDEDDDAAEHAQAKLTAVRKAISAFPLAAALKEIIADHLGETHWRNIRPPLTPLDRAAAARLASALDRLGFAPPPGP